MKKNYLKYCCLGIVLIVVITLILIGIFKNNSITDKGLDKVTINSKEYTLEKGDELTAWLENNYVEFRYETYDEAHFLYNGITLGDSIKNVIKTFGLKNGYAYVEMEVSSAMHGQHGETDIIDFEYKDTSFLKDNFVSLTIKCFYKRVEDHWELIKYSNASELDEEADIIYLTFIFNGSLFNEDANIRPHSLMGFSLNYQY